MSGQALSAARLARRGFETLCIKPGAPWQNASSESCNSRFRDEFLNRELFGGLLESKVPGKEYRHRHNHQRPPLTTHHLASKKKTHTLT